MAKDPKKEEKIKIRLRGEIIGKCKDLKVPIHSKGREDHKWKPR